MVGKKIEQVEIMKMSSYIYIYIGKICIDTGPCLTRHCPCLVLPDLNILGKNFFLFWACDDARPMHLGHGSCLNKTCF